MYCCALCLLKFKLQEQALLKLWVVEYAISFFFSISYVYFNDEANAKFEKIVPFLFRFKIDIFNMFFKRLSKEVLKI